MERAEPLLRECAISVAWELDTAYLYRLLALFYVGVRRGEVARAVPVAAPAHPGGADRIAVPPRAERDRGRDRSGGLRCRSADIRPDGEARRVEARARRRAVGIGARAADRRLRGH